MTGTLPRLAATAVLVLGAVPAPLLAQSVYPTGTTVWARDQTKGGLTLFPTPTGDAILINMAGDEVHRWTSPFPGEDLSMVEPLPGGHILCATRVTPQNRQTVLELDWSGQVVWSFTLPVSQGYIHHDLERLPNGNTLLLCAQFIDVPAISPVQLRDDYIIEVDPGGNVVWSWYTYQHFEEFGFDPLARQLISAQGGDWAHANAVDPLPASSHTDPAFRAGNLVVSQRYTNIVFIIDRTTGAVVWKVGPDDNLTLGQHAPHMIEMGLTGAGNLLVFDNGSGTGYPLQGRSPGASRVVEIDPVTSTIVWEYDYSKSGRFNRLFHSDIVSNAERLPNGNTLICSGVRGRLFEVTRAGRIVWEYMSPYEGTVGRGTMGPLIYRARRVPNDWGGR